MISSKKIEQMAINAIAGLITDKCPRLITNMATNDKTPMVDGDISIYKTEDTKNENFIGKVPVQVKGKTFVNIPNNVAYSIKVSDLRHYLRSGGIIYFVVAINQKKEKVIYYTPLSVVKLQKLISSLDSKQKSVSIRLSKFPTETNKIMDVIRNFYETINKQHSFADKETHPLEYWQSDPNFKGISINAVCHGSEQPTQLELVNSINSHENYVYVNLANCPIPIPASNENIKLGLLKQGDGPVKVGDTIYYDNFTVIHVGQEAQIQFGEAFRLTFFYEEKRNSEFLYTCPAKISQVLKALSFIKAAKLKRECCIGDLMMPNFDLNISIEEIERQETQIKDLTELLNTLHIDVDEIEYNKLSQKELNNLYLLYKGIIKGEISQNNSVKEDFDQSIICQIPIGNKSIHVLVTKERDGNKIEDYFNLQDRVLFLETTEGQFLPSTPYDYLKYEDFCQILNINYHYITEVHKDLYEKYPPIIYNAINTLNKVLSAFDKSNNKRLLQAAIELNEWLQDKEIEGISPYAKMLCNLEIACRSRKITEEERKSLYKIVLDSTDPIDRFSAYVLLGDTQGAKAIFDELSKDRQEYFKIQPIYHLFEKIESRELKKD